MEKVGALNVKAVISLKRDKIDESYY